MAAGTTRTAITSDGGLVEEFPDDTLPAFVAAVAAGADRIELDVHHSRDGHLVVHHPFHLGEGGTAPQYPSTRHDIARSATTVESLTLAELRALDAGGWAGPEHAGVTIPTLAEVVDACPGVGLEVDLKTRSRAFVADVVALLRERDVLDRVEFTSSEHFLLAEVLRHEPDAELGTFHYGDPGPADRALAQDLTLGEMAVGGVRVLHAPLSLLDPPFVARARAAGHRVHASNTDTREQLVQAYELGVDQLSTCSLRLALAVRDEVAAARD